MKETFLPPAFIVGKERSGTTLLSAILNRHPLVCVTYETDFLYKLSQYPNGESGFQFDWPHSLQWIVDSMHPTGDWKRPFWMLMRELDGRRVSGRASFLALGNMIAKKYNKKLWIEKTPNHLLCIPYIRELFPDSPIIHIIRDGRDVAYSLMNVHFGSPRYCTNLWHWRDAVETAYRLLMDDKNAFQFRYEDLVRHPRQTVKRICDFLGLDFHENMLLPDGSEKAIIEAGMPHKMGASRPISASKLEQWKSHLNCDQIAMAEFIAGKTLFSLGYDVSHNLRLRTHSVILDEALLTCRKSAYTYDRLLQHLADKGNTYLTGVGSISTTRLIRPPDYIVTSEFPLENVSGKSRFKLVGQVLRLLTKMAAFRLLGVRIYIVFRCDSSALAKWRFANLVSRSMSLLANVTIYMSEGR